MTEYKYNRILLALIGLGLLAALAIGWQRHMVEENNTRVELVMDYDDVVELAQLEGMPGPELMRSLKEAGLTSLAVTETSLEKLHKTGKLTVSSGADLLALYRAGNLDKPLFAEQNGQIDPARIYIFVKRGEPGGSALFEEVRSDLARRLGPDRIHDVNGSADRLAMAVDANFEKVYKWNLGLPTYAMREVTAAGFNIVARPTNYTKVQPDDISAVFARLNGFDNVSGIMFVGEEALGYPDLLPATARELRERGLKLYMIESPVQLQFLKQEGLLPLAAATGYQAARVYSISKDEQPKLKLDEAVHRWILADQERNIRVNLLRKFEKTAPGLNLFETNVKYVRDVRDGLVENSFTIGPAMAYQTYFPSPWLLAAVIIGATAAGVLLLSLVWPFAPRYQYLLTAIVGLILILPVIKGGGTFVRQAAGTVCAIVFPVLAMTWQLDRWRSREPYQGSDLGKIIVDGVGALALTTLLSLAGGLYLGAVLGDVRFLLEMEIFRGVKLTFVMPLVLISLVYLVRYKPFDAGAMRSPAGIVRQLNRIFDYQVTVKMLCLFGLGAIAAWVYVGRSGHTAGVQIGRAHV